MSTLEETVEEMAQRRASKPNVFEAFAAVMGDVQAVSKSGRNESQNFNFRGIDAVVNAVGPKLREHDVVIVPMVVSANHRDITVGQRGTSMRECTVTVRFRVYGPAGDHFDGIVAAEAMDSGDKGTAKAMSVAYRTFLLQALTIPTDEPDPDSSSYERAALPPPPMHPNKVASLRAKCEQYELSVSEIVSVATDGRTADADLLLASDADAVKAALDLAIPATEGETG